MTDASDLLKKLSEPDRIGYIPEDWTEWSTWLLNRLAFDSVVPNQDLYDISTQQVMDVIETEPCPKCGGFMMYWGNSDSIYGEMSGLRCMTKEGCGHFTVDHSSPPAWFIRESQELDVLNGKARMLPSGDIEYPDEFGGF